MLNTLETGVDELKHEVAVVGSATFFLQTRDLAPKKAWSNATG